MLFYRKISTTSKNQLKNDFGVYPPLPLEPTTTDTQFQVIRVAGIGNKYYTLSRTLGIMLPHLMSSKKNCKQESVTDKMNPAHELMHSLGNFKEALKKIKLSISKFNLFSKIVFFACILAMSPIIIFVTLILIVSSFVRALRVKSIGTNTLGFYSPLTQGRREIVVKPRSIASSSMTEESVVTHEHIHLLQHKVFSNRLGFSEKEILKERCSLLLKTKHLVSEKTFYHLSINEVEARLHEAVIGYYRKFGKLPTDYDGFLRLILSCDILGRFVYRIASVTGKRLPNCDLDVYTLRVTEPVEDILFILDYFDGYENSLRFVCEVLSVMYGNLLTLYGDLNIARDYYMTIESQDLYEVIYGNYSTQPDENRYLNII